MKDSIRISKSMSTVLIRNFVFWMVQPGWQNSSHYHKLPEFIYCREGEATEWVNRQHFKCSAGDWLFLPSGVRHGAFNGSSKCFSYMSIQFDVDDPELRKVLQSGLPNYLPAMIAKRSNLDAYIKQIEESIPFSFPPHDHTGDKRVNVQLSMLQRLTVQAHLLLIILEWIRLSQKDLSVTFEERETIAVSSLELSMAERISAIIEQSVFSDVKINDIAASLGMSPGRCAKVFKKTYGISPRHYLSQLKLNKAKELLMITNLSVEMISEQLGFSSLSHFSRQFSRWTGFSPYRFKPKHGQHIQNRTQDGKNG